MTPPENSWTGPDLDPMEAKRRLRLGDRDAYAAIFRRWHAPMVRYARDLTGSEEAAYDVLQDVFMKLWDIRKTLDGDRPIEGLLYTMTRNRALSMLRKESRLSSLDAMDVQPVESASAPDSLGATELASRIAAWIRGLPERRQEAFVLSREHGLSHREIGHLMGVSEKTVDNHILSALKHLRVRLERYRMEVQR